MDELPQPLRPDNEGNLFLGENLVSDVHLVHDVHPFDLSEAKDPELEEIDEARMIIDNALAVCRDDPAVLGSEEVVDALKTIGCHRSLWFEYRTKIKAAKPSGVLMSEIDEMAAQSSGNNKQDSVSDELIALAMSKCSLFFDAESDKAYVTVDLDGVENTLSIGSKAFAEWLSFAYYTDTKVDESLGKSANESSIKQACLSLSGIAKHEGENQRVYLRVADHGDGHYLFIGDKRRQVVEILPTGWRVIEKSPVKFWMSGSMQSLPIPEAGGELSLLWQFVNIPENDRLLVLAWLLESLRAETPKPILALSGTQGCAKSSTQDKLRQLIDNNAVNLRAAPKSVEDVFVSAGCNWLASFENLSHLTPNLQDAFCTLATGGGFAARTLYTNDEETIIEVKRPVIINSIPNVVTAQDLTDRAIAIELPRITYREEAEINGAWELAKPSILGGLIDLFVNTLGLLPTVKLENPPRMADFTRLGEAMVLALGHPAGTFDKLYKANRAESIGRALEASPVAVALVDMVDSYDGLSPLVFSGTMKALLEKLQTRKQESHSWPKSPRGLGDALRRQLPAFSSVGIHVEISKPGKNGVIVEVRKGEHREHGEHGNTDIHPENEFLNTNSAAFNDAEVF